MNRVVSLPLVAVVLGIVVTGGLLTWVFWPTSSPVEGPQTQREEAAGVTVTVTLGAADDSGIAFQVLLDTHSVDLDAYDLASSTRLVDAKGLEGRPVVTRAPGSTSHHVEAELRFTRPSPGTVRVVFDDLAGVSERTFTFER